MTRAEEPDVFCSYEGERDLSPRSRCWVVWRRTSTAEVEVAAYNREADALARVEHELAALGARGGRQ